MSKLTIYHGSPEIIEKPQFGKGKTYNDYGRGFYCTEHIELAKEWACTEDVDGFVNKYEVPVVKSPCPSDGYTKREYVKDLLRNLNLENPGVKERMFTAIKSGNLKGWTEYFGNK